MTSLTSRRPRGLWWGRIGSGLLLAALGALGSGCKPDLAYLEIKAVTDPPLEVTVGPKGIDLYEGLAVAVDVVAYDDENDEVSQLEAMSDDSTVLGVEDNETEGRWIIYGITPGEASMTFTTVDAEGMLEIPVTVDAQP